MMRPRRVVAVGHAAGKLRPRPAAGVRPGVRMPFLVPLLQEPAENLLFVSSDSKSPAEAKHSR